MRKAVGADLFKTFGKRKVYLFHKLHRLKRGVVDDARVGHRRNVGIDVLHNAVVEEAESAKFFETNGKIEIDNVGVVEGEVADTSDALGDDVCPYVLVILFQEGLVIFFRRAPQLLHRISAVVDKVGVAVLFPEIFVVIDGIADEFCCAGQCTNGNGQKEESLNFTPSGIVTWFVHFYPEWGKLTHSTTTYTFSDGSQTLTLVVSFNFDSQDIESVHSSDAGIQKILKNGIIYIIKDNKIYNL